MNCGPAILAALFGCAGPVQAPSVPTGPAPATHGHHHGATVASTVMAMRIMRPGP
jgi:hypothetical protein